MDDIIIGKARVVTVEEMMITPPPTSDPTSTYNPTATYKPTTTSKPIKVIASKLNIESASDQPKWSSINGVITIPQQLPFGETFFLVLRSSDGSLPVPTGRKFREEE